MEITKAIQKTDEGYTVSLFVGWNLFLNKPITTLTDLEAVEWYMLYALNANEWPSTLKPTAAKRKAIEDKALALWYVLSDFI